MAVWPVGLQIAIGRVSCDAPFNESLAHDLRDRDDYLLAGVNPTPLARACGQYYNAGWVDYFSELSNSIAALNTDYAVVDKIYIWVPNLLAKIKASAYMRVSGYNAGAQHLALVLNGVKGPTVDVTQLANKWYDLECSPPLAVGWQELKIVAWATGGGVYTQYISRLVAAGFQEN